MICNKFLYFSQFTIKMICTKTIQSPPQSIMGPSVLDWALVVRVGCEIDAWFASPTPSLIRVRRDPLLTAAGFVWCRHIEMGPAVDSSSSTEMLEPISAT